MQKLFIYLTAVTLFFSCEEPFKFDVTQTPENYVIEGVVTDQLQMQRVKITKTTGFYSSGVTPRVSNAVVSVTDNAGNTFAFVHNPGNQVDSEGVYLPVVPFAGVVGRTYSLHIEVDGHSFDASDKLPTVIPFDSLTYEIDKEEKEDPEVAGRFYEVKMYAKEPSNENNFYLFKFFRNDSLTFANDTDIYYTDDELLADNIDGVPAPIFYRQNDTARVEAFSISREAYVYYNDLWALLNNDSGGMFGPIPSLPRTNLSNGALGFFQVSAVSVKGIRIE